MRVLTKDRHSFRTPFYKGVWINMTRESIKGPDSVNLVLDQLAKAGMKVHPWICVFTEGQESTLKGC